MILSVWPEMLRRGGACYGAMLPAWTSIIINEYGHCYGVTGRRREGGAPFKVPARPHRSSEAKAGKFKVEEPTPFRAFPRLSAPFRGKRFFPMHSPLSPLTPVQPHPGNAVFLCAFSAFRGNPSLTFRTFPPPIEPSRTFPNHKLFFGCFSGRAKKTKPTKA